MESTHGYKEIILLFILLFSACSTNQEASSSSRVDIGAQNGDLICRLGNGFFSSAFRDYASSDKLYSHIGIVEVVEDSAFVIHVEASELTGVGYVKKESLAKFLEDINTWGLYRLARADTIKQAVVAQAKVYLDKQTPFDLFFNNQDDAEVYCTELVALAINKAVGDSLIKPSLSINGKLLYGLDDVYKQLEVEEVITSNTYKEKAQEN